MKKAYRHEANSRSACHKICICIKLLIVATSLAVIGINFLAMQEISKRFGEEEKLYAEMESLIEENNNLRAESNLEFDSNEMTPASPYPVSKVIPVLRLLESVEKTMHPEPQDNGGRPKKMVILGKTFILKRDFDIWDLTLKNAGYEPVLTNKQELAQHKHDDWLAMLCLDLFDGKSHCIEPSELVTLKRHQKVSRLYGLRKTLWNKDRFCDTLSSSLKGFEPSNAPNSSDLSKSSVDEFTEFAFPCWLLPYSYKDLIQSARTKYKGLHFIAKPTDRGEGNGINVIDNLHDLAHWKDLYPDNDEIVVQTYLPNPLLINQRKWDMRTYVLVTSIHPLRVYMYKDGLVRFASTIYDPNASKGGKKTSFLTNTSVNKKAGIDVEDLTWPFPKVYAYFKRHGIDADLLWKRIERAVVMTLLSSEPVFARGFSKLQDDYSCVNCYQLLGVDVIVDDNLVPRVIEINGEPSMQLSGEKESQYDITKTSMTRDLVQLLYSPHSFSRAVARDLSQLELRGMVLGYEQLGSCVGNGEGGQICLRKADLEYFLDMKKEQQNMGGFRRVFPAEDGDFFTEYIEHLDTKMPYGTPSSTARIHKVALEMAKISKWKTKNDILDPEYFRRTGQSMDFDEEES